MKQLWLGSEHRDANPAPQSLPRLRLVRCPSVCSTAAIRCRRYSPERATPSSRSVAGSKACHDHDRATLCGPARSSSGPRVRTSAAQSSRAASRPLTLALPRHPGQHRDQMQAPPGQLLLPGAVSGELYSDGRAPPSSAIFAFSAAESKSSHILRDSGRSTPSCAPPFARAENLSVHSYHLHQRQGTRSEGASGAPAPVHTLAFTRRRCLLRPPSLRASPLSRPVSDSRTLTQQVAS